MKARIPGAPQGGQQNMMKKIQEMQENMERVQKEVEETEFSSSAGGGAVEVTVNGAHQVTAIKLSPEVVDPEDIEMLEDLILAAVSDAANKAREMMESRMGALTGGMKLPF